MGVEYYVACRTCELIRNVDKCYSFIPCENAADAKNNAELFFNTAGSRYRAMLAMSFFAEHMGHNLTVFSDQSVEEDEFITPTGNLKKRYRWDSRDFWKG